MAALASPGRVGWCRTGCSAPLGAWGAAAPRSAACAVRACLSQGEEGPTESREKEHGSGQLSYLRTDSIKKQEEGQDRLRWEPLIF